MPAKSRSRSGYLPALLGLCLTIAALYFAKPFLVPIALAILLTFTLTPVVSAIQRRGVNRLAAVLLTVFLTFLIAGVVGWIVEAQIQSLAHDLPNHRDEINAKLARIRGDGTGTLPKLQRMLREIEKGKSETNPATARSPSPPPQVVAIEPAESSSFQRIGDAIGPLLEPLAQAGLVVVLVIFMLIGREDLRNRLISVLGHGHLTGTTRVLVESAERLGYFLLTQLLINVGFGVLFTIGLSFAGTPYATLWGFLAVGLRFIPYVGSMIAAFFPVLLAFAVSPGWMQPIVVLVWFAILELVTSNVVEPLLIGHGTGVSPIALLLAATFWTWIWGPVGLVLATPLTVCLTVLGQHVPRLRFVALLLGDKPAP